MSPQMSAVSRREILLLSVPRTQARNFKGTGGRAVRTAVQSAKRGRTVHLKSKVPFWDWRRAAG